MVKTKKNVLLCFQKLSNFEVWTDFVNSRVHTRMQHQTNITCNAAEKISSVMTPPYNLIFDALKTCVQKLCMRKLMKVKNTKKTYNV